VKGKEKPRCGANHVSPEKKVGAEWRYLLVSEEDMATAHGSWEAFEEARRSLSVPSAEAGSARRSHTAGSA
jgi:hypothetical protein